MVKQIKTLVSFHPDYWKTIIEYMEKSTDKEIKMLATEIRSQTGIFKIGV